MNVLTDNSAAGAGIAGIPSLPNLDGASAGAPTIDTTDFDKALKDMENNFAGLQKDLAKPLNNPFAALGDWINEHVVPAMIIFGSIIAVVTILFVAFGFAAIAAAIGVGATIGLIVLAIAAVIAIIILVAKNWDVVWAGIKAVASDVWQFLQDIWDKILYGVEFMLAAMSLAWSLAWDGIKAIWSVVVGFFTAIFEAIKTTLSLYIQLYVQLFSLAWQGIVFVWNAAVGFFQGVWGNVMLVFSAVAQFFNRVFSDAWGAVQNAFGAVGGFFQGVWRTIVSIFGAVGTAIGDSISNSFKSVINTALNFVSDFINNTIRLINSALGVINKLPGVNIRTIATVSLPRLARGGVVDSPTFAQLGEAGAEAVMPLENNTGWIDMLADKLKSANGAGNGQPINLTVQIGEDKIASTVIDLINEKTQMSGRNTILV
jgi:phage-related protein